MLSRADGIMNTPTSGTLPFPTAQHMPRRVLLNKQFILERSRLKEACQIVSKIPGPQKPVHLKGAAGDRRGDGRRGTAKNKSSQSLSSAIVGR